MSLFILDAFVQAHPSGGVASPRPTIRNPYEDSILEVGPIALLITVHHTSERAEAKWAPRNSLRGRMEHGQIAIRFEGQKTHKRMILAMSIWKI